jgi:hypothetical protein
MSYTHLSKAQLIERIHELESQTLQAQVAVVRKEAKLAWEDLLKMMQWLYNSGAASRKALVNAPAYQGAVSFVQQRVAAFN